MTVDHISGSNQNQWPSAEEGSATDRSGRSGDSEDSKPSEPGHENNGVVCKMDEANGDVNGKLLELAMRDAQITPKLPQNTVGTNDDSDEEDADNGDLRCGLGVLSPKWMQVFASKQAFLVTFCITWVLQGMYYTYFVSVITTIEKLFQIQSKTTGIIMSATEIGQIGSSLLLTYYGGQGHRPKWIAWGMVLFAVSSFTCSLPHFIFGEQLLHANDILYSGSSSKVDVDYHESSSNLCRSPSSDNFPPPMLIQDHLDFLKENPNYNIRNSFLMLHSESQTSDKIPGSEVSGKSNDRHHHHHHHRHRNHSDKNRTSFSNFSSYSSLKSEENSSAECEEDLLQEQRTQSKITQIVLAIFFISLLGVGMGQTAVYTLGIPYIDDNVASRESPLYFGKSIYLCFLS